MSELLQPQPGKPDAEPVQAIAPSGDASLAKPDLAAIASTLQLALGARFELVRPLAVGGMATLFQLRHRLHRGLFAAKVLHPHLASRQELVASFRTEAIHAATLGAHPNVVPVYDLGEFNGLLFMLMPFIEGEDLDRLLKRLGCFTREEGLLFAAQLASVLQHAERHGIAHCDLAPGNIRLDPFGQFQIFDFGLSRSRHVPEGSVQTGGTPAYNSPEQVRGESSDIRSDVYALGVMLFEVLTGKPLFDTADLAQLAACHLRGEWTAPPTLSADPPLLALLRDMLAVDPASRIPNASELVSRIAALGVELSTFPRSPLRVVSPQTASEAHKRRLTSL